MKTNIKYRVIREDGIEKEFDTLKEAELFQKEIKYRRTGKTYIALFSALAVNPESFQRVIIIAQTRVQAAKNQYPTFLRILDSLDFKYKANKQDLTVENLGRTFVFMGPQDHGEKLRGLGNYTIIYDMD